MANAGNRNSDNNKVCKDLGNSSPTKACEKLKVLKERFEVLSELFNQLNLVQLDGNKKINSLKETIEDLFPCTVVPGLNSQILDVKGYDDSVRKLLDSAQCFFENAKLQDKDKFQLEPLEPSKNFKLQSKSKIEYSPSQKSLLDKSSQAFLAPQYSSQSCQTEPVPETLLCPQNCKKDINEFKKEKNHKLHNDTEIQTNLSTLSINIKLEPHSNNGNRKARASLPGNFSNAIQPLFPQNVESKTLAEEKFSSEVKDIQVGLGIKRLESSNQILNTQVNKKPIQKTVGVQTPFVYEHLLTKVKYLACMYSEMVHNFKKFREFASVYDDYFQQTYQGMEEQTWQAVNNLRKSNKELARRYKQEMSLRKKYHNELMQLRGNIRVFCRIRPPTAADEDPNSCCISVSSNDRDIIFVKNKNKLTRFEMDRVFPKNCSQSEVFDEIRSLVTSCIDGFNVCILAYGQTGSGKTYTMEGTSNNPGMNQRALKDLFKETALKDDWNYSISVSMLEIYNEQIRDLLNDDATNKLEVWNVEDMTIIPVYSAEEVNKVCASGHKNRAKATTDLNTSSSRSHALLCVRVEGGNQTTNTQTKGKLYLIDLAGSENVEKSGVNGQRLKEAGFINKSLSTFSDVINAILLKKTHIPYRNSKLTHLLQDSLGGNSKTLLITQVAPGDSHVSETLQTLQFAQRIRSIQCLSSNSKSRERLDSERSDKSENSKNKETDDENSPAPMSSIPPRFASMFLASPTKISSRIFGTPQNQTKRKKSLTSKFQ